MKKLLLVLTLLLVFGVWSAPALAAEVYYNGRLLCQSEHRYDSIDGASVPVRQLFEGLGYKVGWNAEYNNVYLEHPQRGSIILQPGNRNARLLGYFEYQLPVAPYFVEDVLYVPLGLLKHEYCGYNLEWRPTTESWQISEAQQQFVYPFAGLTKEQLTGVTMHYGKKGSSIPVYTAELNDEEIAELLKILQPLAYREPAFTGEDIEFSGGNPLDFDLYYADGTKLGFGESACFFYFFREHEEPKGYVPADDSQRQALRNFLAQLKEKYLAGQND